MFLCDSVYVASKTWTSGDILNFCLIKTLLSDVRISEFQPESFLNGISGFYFFRRNEPQKFPMADFPVSYKKKRVYILGVNTFFL